MVLSFCRGMRIYIAGHLCRLYEMEEAKQLTVIFEMQLHVSEHESKDLVLMVRRTESTFALPRSRYTSSSTAPS